MEGGVVKEFDSVPSLMGRSGSTFRSMVVQAGLESAASGSISRIASMAKLAAKADAPVAGAQEEEEEEGAPSPGSEEGGNGGSGAAAAISAAPGGRRPEGLPTFVKRMREDYDMK